VFRAEASFHHAHTTSLEMVLKSIGWTDVIRVEVEGEIVYQDDAGISNDLIPALEAVSELYLDGRTRYTVSLGRQVGPWNHISRVSSSALGLLWHKSVRDRRLDPGPEEDLSGHRERLSDWIERGYLEETENTLNQQLASDLDSAREAGLKYNHGTRRGPWMELWDSEPDDVFAALHALYASTPPSSAVDRALLHTLRTAEPPCTMEICVHTGGESIPLEQYRDQQQEPEP